DWYAGTIAENVIVDETAYLETTFSFYLYRSVDPVGVRIGRGASTYLGTMFDAGPRARISLGDYALVHGARIICDEEIVIGDYALISYDVLLLDTYRLPLEPSRRRRELERLALRSDRCLDAHVPARPFHIERNLWMGLDACVLPGVTIGEGAIVGARAVVTEDVPPYTVVAGNPSRVIRRLDTEAISHES